MNFTDLFRIKSIWDQFTRNHPKFPLFLQAVSRNAIKEGTILEIQATTEEGETYSSNLKISADDMALIAEMRELLMNMRQ